MTVFAGTTARVATALGGAAVGGYYADRAGQLTEYGLARLTGARSASQPFEFDEGRSLFSALGAPAGMLIGRGFGMPIAPLSVQADCARTWGQAIVRNLMPALGGGLGNAAADTLLQAGERFVDPKKKWDWKRTALSFAVGAGQAVGMRQLLAACFTAGTHLLVTPDTSKPIEEFKSYEKFGDECDTIFTRSEFDPASPLESRRVLRKFVRVSPVLNFHVNGKVIETTREHPFFIEGRGWMPAAEVEIGDLVRSHIGETFPVEGVADSGRVETVYNLEVEEHHTYFVGEAEWGWSVWAHNAKGYFGGITTDERRSQVLLPLEVGLDPIAGLIARERNPTAKAHKQVRDGKPNGPYQDLLSESILQENAKIHAMIEAQLNGTKPAVILSEPRSGTLLADIYEGGTRLEHGGVSRQVKVSDTAGGKDVADMIVALADQGHTSFAVIEAFMSNSTRSKYVGGFVDAPARLKTTNPTLADQLAGDFHFLREMYGFEHAVALEGGLSSTARDQMTHLCRCFLCDRVAGSFRRW